MLSKTNYWDLILILSVLFENSNTQGSGTDGKLRVCIVEGRGAFRTAAKSYCRTLDVEPESRVECVIGTDRMDCLRRMHKGTVDFGVFSPEDLVATQWANLDVLVTNEMRTRHQPFESSVVAVVYKQIIPDSPMPVRGILNNVTLCHPGLGGEDSRGLTDTIYEYLQNLVTDRSCDEALSLAENNLRAMSRFFWKACKPGPWSVDVKLDRELKSRYPNLCAACSSSCSTSDRFWGDAGALACVEANQGFTWLRLHNVQGYFGLQKPTPSAVADRFAYLCPDGTWQQLNNNPSPCVWLNRPWPVVVAKRKSAEAVSSLVTNLTAPTLTSSTTYLGALSGALGVLDAQPTPLLPPHAPLDYLARANRFREAYAVAACNPPRHITLCAPTTLETLKCDWLAESGAVYGIVPPLQCSKRSTMEACFEAVEKGESDVVVADSDWLVRAQRDYAVAPLLHETTPVVEQTRTIVAYVRKESKMASLSDLRGKRAAFPRFDGFAWHSVSRYLSTNKSRCSSEILSYFSEICAPGIEKENNLHLVEKLTKNCYKDSEKILDGERQALRALLEERVDVAFISMKTFNEYSGNTLLSWSNDIKKIEPLCMEDNTKYCFISWSNLGHVYAAKNLTSMRKHEIINVFTKLDQLFGKHYPFHTAMFSMYGVFNKYSDVLFHNNTRQLSTNAVLTMYPYAQIPMNFERDLRNFSFNSCLTRQYLTSAAILNLPVFFVLCVSLVSILL